MKWLRWKAPQAGSGGEKSLGLELGSNIKTKVAGGEDKRTSSAPNLFLPSSLP